MLLLLLIRYAPNTDGRKENSTVFGREAKRGCRQKNGKEQERELLWGALRWKKVLFVGLELCFYSWIHSLISAYYYNYKITGYTIEGGAPVRAHTQTGVN